jgi:endonuclease/exonuclease/phosphatase family metal-dependent hydrolase
VLRLLTWNVRDLLGDPLAVARVVRAAAPDVACLQEGPRWPGSGMRLARLARDCGLSVVAGGRHAAGVALLAGPGVRAVGEAFRLPTAGGLRVRPRGAATARVRVAGGGPLVLAGVHLGLDPDERERHVLHLVSRLRGVGLPVVVAGDLNEGPDGPAWRSLSAVAADPAPTADPTFPSWRPRLRIDAVLTAAAVGVAEYDVWRPDPEDLRAASDHRPVLVTLSVGPASRRRP